MSITRKWGRIALMLVWVAVIASGCTGGGAAATPGWTVAAADQNGVVGVFPAGLVVALDPKSGQELWNYPTATQSSTSPFSCSAPATSDGTQKPFEAVYGQPVLTEDLILFGSYDHSVYALNRDPALQAPARVKWSFKTEGAIIGGVTLYEDGVYFGSADYNVYAVSLADGKALWDAPFITEEAIWGTPVVDEQYVYIGSMDHAVYALDRATGRQVWRTDVGAAVPGSVVLADGVVFAASLDQRLHALRVQDGSEAWVSDELGAWLMSQPTVRDSYVYVATLDGQVYGFDVESGQARWAAIALDSSVRAGLVWLGDAADSRLIAATEAGKLYSIDVQTGAETELYTTPSSMLSEPSVVGATLYVGTTAGQIYALNATADGGPFVWVYPATAAN